MAIVVRGKWKIIGSALVFALIALAYLWVASPVYRSTALVQINGQNNALGMAMETLNPKEEIEVLRSPALLQALVRSQKLDIQAEPDYLPLLGRAVARHFSNTPENRGQLNSPWPGLSGYAWGGEVIAIERFELPDGMDGEKYTLVAGVDGQYQLYYRQQKQLEGQVGTMSLSFNGQLALQVSALKARPGTRFRLSRQSMGKALEQLNKELKVAEKGKNIRILSVSLSGPSPQRNNRILGALVARYTSQTQAQVAARVKLGTAFLQQQLPEMKAAMVADEDKLNRFQTTLLKQQATRGAGQDSTDLSFQKKMEGLVQAWKASQQRYNEALNNLMQLQMAQGTALDTVRVIGQPLSSVKPVRPKKGLIAVLALLLGVVLGGFWVFLADMLRQGIKTPQEIEAATRLSVYGLIPASRRADAGSLAIPGAVDEEILESLRRLRASLLFTLMDGRNNRIMITAAASGSGKALVSAHLAVVLAEAGKKVLLVDADRHQGGLSPVFGVPAGDGLWDILSGRANGRPVHRVRDNCDLLTAGHIPPGASELLLGSAFSELLEQLSQRHDMVIIHTPSVQDSADAMVVGRYCDTRFMVAKTGVTTVSELEFADHCLRGAQVDTTGCIVNGVPRKTA